MQYEGLRCSFSYKNLSTFQHSTLNKTVDKDTISSWQMNHHKGQTIYCVNQLPPRSSDHILAQQMCVSNNNYPSLLLSPNSPYTKLKKGNRQTSKTANKLINRNSTVHTEIDQDDGSRKIRGQNLFGTAPEIIGNISQISNLEGNSLKLSQQSDYMQAQTRLLRRQDTNFRRSNSCSKQSIISTTINNPLQMFCKNRLAKENEVNCCAKESSYHRQNRYLLAQMKIQKQTIQNFQNQIMRLNREIRVIRNQEQSYKSDCEGLQIRIEQLRSSQQSIMNDFVKLKDQSARQYAKKSQSIEALSNQIKQLQKLREQYSVEVNRYQQMIVQYQDQNGSLNRLVEGQSSKLEDQEVSARIDRQEISVMLMKLEACQNRYQQQNHLIAELQIAKTKAIQQLEITNLNWKQQKAKFEQERPRWKQRQGLLLQQNKQISHLADKLKIEVCTLSSLKDVVERQRSQEKNKRQTQNFAITTALRAKEQLCIKLSDQCQEKRKQSQNLRKIIEISKNENEQIVQELFKRQQELKCKRQQMHLILKNIHQRDTQILAIQGQVEILKAHCVQVEGKYSNLLNNYQSVCSSNKKDNAVLKQLEGALVKQRQQYPKLINIIQNLEIGNTDLQVRLNQLLAQREIQRAVYSQMENNLETLSASYCELKKKNDQLQGKMGTVFQGQSQPSGQQRQLIKGRRINQQSQQKIRVLENSYEDYKAKTGQIICELNNKIQILIHDLANINQFQKRIKEDQKQEIFVNQLKRNYEKEIKEIELRHRQQQDEIVGHYNEQILALLQTIKTHENMYKVQIQTLISQIERVQQEKGILNAKIIQIQQNRQLELPIEKQRQIKRQTSDRLKVRTERSEKIGFLSESSSVMQLSNTEPNLYEKDSFGQDYVEVDREGLIYMCALLGIQIREGSILNTLISALEKLVQENRKCKTLSSFYLELLELFGIEHYTNHHQLIMAQISNFRENIQYLIQKLKEEEQKSESLFHQRNDLENQLQIQCAKGTKTIQQLQRHNQLIIQLNETIIRQNMQIGNSRRQIQQVMHLTRQPFQRSEQFQTVNSFASIEEKEKKRTPSILIISE